MLETGGFFAYFLTNRVFSNTFLIYHISRVLIITYAADFHMASRDKKTSSAHSPVPKPSGETPRCALSEEGRIVYANDAFFALTKLENSRADRVSAFDVLSFADEHLAALKSLKDLPEGVHDILLKNGNRLSSFHFDWVQGPDQTRYMIASLLRDHETALTPESLETIIQNIARAPHSQKKPAASAMITDLHDLLAFSALSHDLMIITDPKGHIVKASPSFYQTLGYAPKDLRGCMLSNLSHEEDRESISAALKTGGELESRLITQNGSLRWVAWDLQISEASVYLSGRDVTDIKKQHSDLLRQKKQLCEAESIGHMGHWRWVVGQEDIAWSDELYQIFGQTTKGFSPAIQSMSEMVHEEDVERLIQMFQRAVIEKKNYDMEFRITRPNGETRYILCEGRCEKDSDGDVSALYGIMQDMTQRILYEQELRNAKDASEHAYAAKSRFLANMSHELRTPLNAIIGFSEMMSGQVYGPLGHEKYNEYAKHIHESGALLLDIIGDILDMSKIEAGKYELSPEEINLEDVVTRAVTMLASRAEQSGVTLQTQHKEIDGLSLFADRRALVQILLNLLSNAIKFTSSGGRVSLECEKKQRHCVLKVIDTGVGIPPNKLAAVLRPFEQVSSTYTRNHEGSGLGLSITRELVELHGGSVSIASKVGAGTTVTLRLPYRVKNRDKKS